MSNLLKKYYVTNVNTTARVIDSNKRVDDVIKERSSSKFHPISFTGKDLSEYEETYDDYSDGMEEEASDGFVAGIEVEQIDPDQYIQADEMYTQQTSMQVEAILEEARLQAAAIIAEGEQNAANIIAEAQNEAEEIRENAKKLGYEEGSAEKLADVMKMQDGINAELEEKTAQLEEEYNQKAEVLENDLVDAIITVFNKVFNIQFDDKKAMLLHLVKNVLMNVEVGKEFRIHVSQNNYRFINSHLDDLRINVGNDVSIEVVNDAQLGPEDCQIETSFGVFDCSIDMELNNLVKDIRSLCS